MTNNIIFSQKILIWYKSSNIENLPWQLNKTMYHVWLSEIMLQQTQVRTVIPYYIKFIEKFPTITKLAVAELNEILYLWSGLGYYVRAKNLHKTANIIVKHYNNIFPEDFNTLISFPGIGRSTAGAILSLTLNKRYPILDSNIKRILMRYYAIDIHAKKQQPKKNYNKILWYLSEKLIPKTEISTFNQAMMNFGQLICTNKKPKCNCCPVHHECQIFSTHSFQKYQNIPNNKKLIKKTIWLLLLLQRNNMKIWLEQRSKPGIWKELFCFPDFPDLDSLNNWIILHNLHNNQSETMTFLKYRLSNINLEMRPILLYIDNKLNYCKKNGIWCDLFNIPIIGIPKPIWIILEQLQTKYNI